jgi:hypothetical protein
VKMRERKRGRFTHVNVLNLARILQQNPRDKTAQILYLN